MKQRLVSCPMCHLPSRGAHKKGFCARMAPKDPHRVHRANVARKRAQLADQATAGRGVTVSGIHKPSASSKKG